MDAINVLITGAGAPGTKGTIYSLRNNFDGRAVRVTGVDIQEDVVGRYLCDYFYQIPRPCEESFIPRLCAICQKRKIDVLLPQVTDELFILAQYKEELERVGTTVAISGREAIQKANNKYELMKVARDMELPVPKFFLADNIGALREYMTILGWPEKPVVIKPPVSSGMRGLRIIYEKHNPQETFYLEKPGNIYIKFDELQTILGHSFPELLVMQFLPGKEYSVDMLVTNNNLVSIPRTRDTIRAGITFSATVEKNEQIIEYSRKLANRLGLEYAFGFQFKLDEYNVARIIESNPRVQGTMVLSTFAGANIIYGAVKHALGEKVPKFKIKAGTRLLRYWGGIAVVNQKTVGEIL